LVAFKTDTSKIVYALNQLALASNTIVTLYNGQTKVGTDTKTTLRLTVSGLIEIFDKHCQGASRKRIKRGAIVQLSEHEQRESKFVRVALKAANEMRVSKETLADLIRNIKAARPVK